MAELEKLTTDELLTDTRWERSAYLREIRARLVRLEEYESVDQARARLAVETQAEKAIRERLEKCETAASALLDAMDTCHACNAKVHVEAGPIHCLDCSADCNVHDEPDCTSIADLHQRLRAALEHR